MGLIVGERRERGAGHQADWRGAGPGETADRRGWCIFVVLILLVSQPSGEKLDALYRASCAVGDCPYW